MKLSHALQIYSTVFVKKKCICVAFFKVIEQHTIGEVAKSITYLRADNFCL